MASVERFDHTLPWSLHVPINPASPQPPFSEPGKSPPLPEVQNPGHGHPEREADPEPLEEDDDPLTP